MCILPYLTRYFINQRAHHLPTIVSEKSLHKSGCARCEGYYRVDKAVKARHLQDAYTAAAAAEPNVSVKHLKYKFPIGYEIRQNNAHYCNIILRI